MLQYYYKTVTHLGSLDIHKLLINRCLIQNNVFSILKGVPMDGFLAGVAIMIQKSSHILLCYECISRILLIFSSIG